MVLAILYDEQTPFSKMRLQAAELARTLLSSPHTDEPGKWIREYPESDPESRAALEIALASLPPLFKDVPPPSVSETASSGLTTAAALPPSPASSAVGEIASKVTEAKNVPISSQRGEASAMQAFTLPLPSDGSPPFTARESTIKPFSVSQPLSGSETVSSPQAGSMPLPPNLLGDVPISRPAPPSTTPLPSLQVQLPGSSPALTDLYLTVVMLPRLPKHHLVGDLAALLPQWVAQLCLSHAWRLESLRVRPDFLGWVVSIPLTTSAHHHLRVMRSKTSEYIFAEFPTLARENPSGEFWAPGYLVTSSGQLPAESAIQNLITLVRQQQGISKPYSE
jgi:REP element-mobilizing transposase RayT